jgi:hypothetical protein
MLDYNDDSCFGELKVQRETEKKLAEELQMKSDEEKKAKKEAKKAKQEKKAKSGKDNKKEKRLGGRGC